MTDALTERLEADRADAVRRLDALTADVEGVVAASRHTNADDEHDPEGATIAFERSQLQALVRQARSRVADLDAALARARAGTYGVCERCGASIPAARLDARPDARTCVGCAAQRT